MKQTKTNLRLPMILISLPWMVMSVLLPIYTTSLGLSALETTGLFSLFSGLLVLARLLIGNLSDRVGRKPVFLTGVVLYAASYAMFAAARSLPLLYAARSLQAVANVLVMISVYGIAADAAAAPGLYRQGNAAQGNAARGDTAGGGARRFGLLGGYTSQGGLLGAALCYFAFRVPDFADGWFRLFTCCAGGCAVAFFYSLTHVSETSPRAGKHPPGSFSWIPPAGKRGVFMLHLAAELFSSMMGVIFVLYIDRRFDAQLMDIALAFLLPAVVSAAASGKIGAWADQIGHGRATASGLILCACAAAALPFAKTVLAFGLIWTVYCVASSLSYVALDGSYAESGSGNGSGGRMGLYAAGGNVGGMIGPLAGGFLFTRVGAAAPFWASAVCFALLAAAAAPAYRKREG